MRKLLLATSALVALTGTAMAAESPITVNVGGYVDFRAAMFHESTDAENLGTGAIDRRDHDFETEYRLNISAEGKAANGIEYGALVSLWNGATYNDNAANSNVLGGTNSFSGGGNSVRADQAYVWMSGAWGKTIFGDDHGASDLFVYAPTVGEGQIDGTYTDFTDPTTLMRFQPSFIDNTENSTKITYYTPKVGNANHKLQLGGSYAPNFYDQGQNVIKYSNNTARSGTALAPYQDFVEATAQYTGNWSPVNTVLSATMSTGARGDDTDVLLAAPLNGPVRDFTSWGLGGQAMYAGFTLGGSYVDAGRYLTVEGQNKDQSVWTAGLKYEFDKVALAVNGMRGEGYGNAFAQQGVFAAAPDRVNYVKDFSAVGLGATYTWFPGLTTAADVVLFEQQRDDVPANTADAGDRNTNAGHVLMLSQKVTF
ncbi:MAG: porin [Alphaproteobacteria bacterium]|nr:porin [Alphaproteobacteria bacterium]